MRGLSEDIANEKICHSDAMICSILEFLMIDVGSYYSSNPIADFLMEP